MCEGCTNGTYDETPMTYAYAVDTIKKFQESILDSAGYNYQDPQLQHLMYLQRERIINALFMGPTIEELNDL